MSRIYDFETLVTIPRCTALTLYTMVQEACDTAQEEKDKLAAKGKTFPEALELILGRLKEAHTQLGALMAPSTEASSGTREADNAVDNAWGALYEFLHSWLRSGPEVCPVHSGVEALMNLIFSDGKTFLQLDYKSEWAQSDLRLNTLKTSPHIETVQALGGLPLVNGIENAHRKYGEVLGITKQPEAESEGVKDLYMAVQSHLREYICKAVAHTEVTKTDSSPLSRALLKPIETWISPTSSSSTSSKTPESSDEGSDDTPPETT